MSRERKTNDTNLEKAVYVWKVSLSKSRVVTLSQSGFHLLERMLVVAADLAGRKERM
jgi:hypothetical protein